MAVTKATDKSTYTPSVRASPAVSARVSAVYNKIAANPANLRPAAQALQPVNLAVPAPIVLGAGTTGPVTGDAQNSPLIDEKELGTKTGMPRTLADIMGSGTLTQAQVDSAALTNVLTLFTCESCTSEQKVELGLYLQRFILDGNMRGVDVIGRINEQGGVNFNMNYAPNSGMGGMASVGGGKNVSMYGWGDGSDGWKMSNFYHEVGHNVLDLPHTSDSNSIMEAGANDIGILKSPKWLDGVYDYAMGELFNPDNWKKTSVDANGDGTPDTPVLPPIAAPTADKYPSLTPGAPLPTPPANAPVPTGTGPSPNSGPITGGGPSAPMAPIFGPAPVQTNFQPSIPIGTPGARMMAGSSNPNPYQGQAPGIQSPNPYAGPGVQIPDQAGSGPPRRLQGGGGGGPNPFQRELDRMLSRAGPMLRGLGGALSKG